MGGVLVKKTEKRALYFFLTKPSWYENHDFKISLPSQSLANPKTKLYFQTTFKAEIYNYN
jgi:hypothetical protein